MDLISEGPKILFLITGTVLKKFGFRKFGVNFKHQAPKGFKIIDCVVFEEFYGDLNELL